MTETPPLRVMVVDDDRVMLHLIGSWLRSQGWEVSLFPSPMDALHAYSQSPFSAAVLDWHMPGIDGLELVKRIRSANQSQSCYTILVTASEDPTLLMRAFDEGVDDFLRKPLSKPEFVSRLKAARRVCLLEQEVRLRSENDLERQMHAVAMQRMSAVAGAVAHELRTPLGSLRMATERLSLKRAKLPEDVQKIVQRLEETSSHMAETLENVLETFGVASRKGRWERVDLQTLAVQAVEHVRHRVQPGVEVLIEAEAPAGPFVCCDATSIRRLMTNLLANALRHTPTGNVTLRLLENDASSVLLEISDTGEGIPPDLLPWLGNPLLVNSENAHVGRFVQGAGLGLSLCRRIVEQHGGFLSLDSVLGEGTTIRSELRRDLEGPAEETGTGFFSRSGRDSTVPIP